MVLLTTLQLAFFSRFWKHPQLPTAEQKTTRDAVQFLVSEASTDPTEGCLFAWFPIQRWRSGGTDGSIDQWPGPHGARRFSFFLEFSSISWIRGGFAIRIFLRFLESKNLCQNAFSSRSAMSGSLGALEWIFVSSPRLATGPEAPHISDGRELGALEIAESMAIILLCGKWWMKWNRNSLKVSEISRDDFKSPSLQFHSLPFTFAEVVGLRWLWDRHRVSNV